MKKQNLFMIFSTLCLVRQINCNKDPKNVLGDDLKLCSTDPMTGWNRDGFCQTDDSDQGTHTICAEMTKEFLDYTKTQGNDLTTPQGSSFPGLKPGDHWCLCSIRWNEAHKVGKAPKVNLESTHVKALEINPIDILKLYSNPN